VFIQAEQLKQQSSACAARREIIVNGSSGRWVSDEQARSPPTLPATTGPKTSTVEPFGRRLECMSLARQLLLCQAGRTIGAPGDTRSSAGPLHCTLNRQLRLRQRRR
jgi:hypothetical protein